MRKTHDGAIVPYIGCDGCRVTLNMWRNICKANGRAKKRRRGRKA